MGRWERGEETVIMMSVEEAREAILARFHSLPGELTPLPASVGRGPAEDAVAPEDLPSFANSAVDGYAVRASDTTGADQGHPRRLTLAGEVPAGSVYPGELRPGEAIRILTGAPIPTGADSVVEQELTAVDDATVWIQAAVSPGSNIRVAGDDVPLGTLLLRRGVGLGPVEGALPGGPGLGPGAVTTRPPLGLSAPRGER